MKRKHLPKSYFSFNLNIFKVLSIILITIFICFTPLLIKRSIKITKIECNSQFGQCIQEYSLGNYKYVHDQIEKQLSQDIQVNSYLIQYKIPHTIKVEVNLKSPKNAIYSVQENKYYLIGKDGFILSTTDNTDLPKIFVENLKLNIGQTISERDKHSLELLNNLVFLYTINEGKIENEAITFVNSDGIKILFPLEGDTSFLIGSLRLIFSRLNDESEGIRMNEIHEIDLRFKNPVLR